MPKKTIQKKRIKNTFSLNELPRHLRLLADMISQGKVPLAENIELNTVTSFKIIFKYDDYKELIKARIIFEYPEVKESKKNNDSKESEIREPKKKKDHEIRTIFLEKNKNKKKKPAFKKLKDRMDTMFREIFNAIASGNLPGGELCERFYDDCETMTLYTEYNNVFNEDFLKSARDLAGAVHSLDLATATAACNRIAYIKNECHKLNKVDD